MSGVIFYLRLARVGLHLASGLAQCALLFPVLPLAARNSLVRRWSARLIGIFGIRVDVAGPSHHGAGAVVANHVSWIDVFVLNAVAPCRFVAKAEVRAWPAIGWLSARAGTVYIARQRRADLIAANATMAAHLVAGERLALFPEGTSGPQGSLLPFHANLFQAIVLAQAPVLPVAIAYLDGAGALSDAADYIGEMTLWDSIVRLLGGGPLTASVTFATPIASVNLDRRLLATASHAAVAGALAQAFSRPPR